MSERIDESSDFETRAVRAGTERSQFNEHSEALFLTSSFVFDNAAQAAARFSGAEAGNVYSRFTNPTVTMFEQRLASLEGAEDCLATASGMAAIMATCLATLRAGDHVICAANVFGATIQLFSNVLSRFGIAVTYVDATDIASVACGRHCEHASALLRNAVESANGARRSDSVRSVWASDRRALGRGQLLLHAGVATSVRVRRRCGDSLGNEVSGRTGSGARRRRTRIPRRSFVISCCRCFAVAGRACRRLTPGCCSKGLKRLRYACVRKATPRRSWPNGSRVGPRSRACTFQDCNRILRRPGSPTTVASGCRRRVRSQGREFGRAACNVTERGA